MLPGCSSFSRSPPRFFVRFIHFEPNINPDLFNRRTRMAQITPESVRVRLVYDGCFNIAAAGAIMRTYLNEAQGDLMLAIGYYHSHTPALNLDYQSKVLASAYRLFARSKDYAKN